MYTEEEAKQGPMRTETEEDEKSEYNGKQDFGMYPQVDLPGYGNKQNNDSI